jgi:ATP dependent DNA ligase domain
MDPRNQTRRLPRDHSARGRVRLFTRNGHDWSDRFPLISEAALRNRNSSFVIDGEAVLLGVDGRSDFNGLHSRRHDAEVQFYAFDMLAGDGDDMRKLPLSMRKTNLARLLRGRAEGIFVAGPKRCRSKAVAALVSERRTKRRGERAGTCWPPVLPKKCFAISVGRPTLNFGVARGECSVFSSPQGHGSGSPIGPSSFGAAQMP